METLLLHPVGRRSNNKEESVISSIFKSGGAGNHSTKTFSRFSIEYSSTRESKTPKWQPRKKILSHRRL